MKIFISYSSVDRIHAFDLLHLLEKNGCDAWLDFMDIKPTEVLDMELSQNLKKADWVCLLLSPSSVASKWVEYEIKRANEYNVKLLPIILRPCKLPDTLREIIGIDASIGILEESKSMQILRTILGNEKVEESILLDSGKRMELSRQALQAEADKELPIVNTILDNVRNLPIRKLNVTINRNSFIEAKNIFLELRLNLKYIANPISFYFAPFKEGNTWPEEFGFIEPSYKQFYNQPVVKIDTKFRWYDQVLNMNQVLDYSDFRLLNPVFEIHLNGKKFKPKISGVDGQHELQLPTVTDLVRNDCRFELFAHFPSEKKIEIVNIEKNDYGILVEAIFKNYQPEKITLYKSQHTTTERTILGCSYLLAVKNSIEKEILLGLCPSSNSEESANVTNLDSLKILEEGAFIPPQFELPAAYYFFNQALFLKGKNKLQQAISFFSKTLDILINKFNGYPTYEEGVLAFRTTIKILEFLFNKNDLENAKKYTNLSFDISLKLIEIYPDEPDFKRMLAQSELIFAKILIRLGNKIESANALKRGVDIFLDLYEKISTPECFMDYRAAVADVVVYGIQWEIKEYIPFDEFASIIGFEDAEDNLIQKISHFNKSLEMNEETKRELRNNKLADEIDQETAEYPSWFLNPSGDSWKTRMCKSPVGRYSIPVPVIFSEIPEIRATLSELMHIYFGSIKELEFLSISYMDKAIPGHDMKAWVSANEMMLGFPIREMINSEEDSLPELVNWRYLGSLQKVADEFDVDELHAYTGFAFSNNIQVGYNEPLGARMYVVLARKNTFAWKIQLVIHSAAIPGVPYSLVYENDHIRAAAIFSNLKLGE